MPDAQLEIIELLKSIKWGLLSIIVLLFINVFKKNNP